MRRVGLTTFVAMFALAPAIALAHPGRGDGGDASGFMHGLAHPITGFDHVLAMVAVGVLAAQLGGRALWLVPLSFVGLMAVAAALAMAGIHLAVTEIGIALSILVLGLAIALPRKLPALAAMALVGFFGVFHGHVHGAEMPATVSALPYATGFLAATVLLHATGVSLGLLFSLEGSRLDNRVVQIGGGAMALFGASILVSAL